MQKGRDSIRNPALTLYGDKERRNCISSVITNTQAAKLRCTFWAFLSLGPFSIQQINHPLAANTFYRPLATMDSWQMFVARYRGHTLH